MPSVISGQEFDKMARDFINVELSYERKRNRYNASEMDLYGAGIRLGIYELLIRLRQQGLLILEGQTIRG